MRSDRCGVAACTFGLSLVLLSLGQARVHAAEHTRLVFRVTNETERALVPRLRGQLSDVAAELITVETAALDAELAKQVEVARGLALEHAASVVIWCDSALAAPDLVVNIALPERERLLTRKLSGVGDSRALSASTLEAAALLVRGAVLALRADAQVGTPFPQALADAQAPAPDQDIQSVSPATAAQTPPPSASDRNEPPVGEPATPDSASLASTAQDSPAPRAHAPQAQVATPKLPAQPTRTQRREQLRSGTALQARFAVGAQLAVDGQSTWGQRGALLQLGIGMGDWTLAAYGVLSWAASIPDANFALRVARHALFAKLERSLARHDNLQVALALHAGTLLLHRTAQSKTDKVVSYPAASTAVFALGPELALVWANRSFGVGLRLGVDITPSSPRFETAGTPPQHPRVSHRLWAATPRLALSWEAALP